MATQTRPAHHCFKASLRMRRRRCRAMAGSAGLRPPNVPQKTHLKNSEGKNIWPAPERCRPSPCLCRYICPRFQNYLKPRALIYGCLPRKADEMCAAQPCALYPTCLRGAVLRPPSFCRPASARHSFLLCGRGPPKQHPRFSGTRRKAAGIPRRCALPSPPPPPRQAHGQQGNKQGKAHNKHCVKRAALAGCAGFCTAAGNGAVGQNHPGKKFLSFFTSHRTCSFGTVHK